MKNWYIIQSHSSFENKVAKLIKEEAKKSNISEKIEEIVVPTHDVTEVRRGKRVQRKKKYFPGYVLMKSEMDKDLYHMIKNIKKVSGFLGSKGIPAPVSDKEIDKILDLDDEVYICLMHHSKKVATAMKKALDCQRIGVSVVGFEVPHAHVHLIPINKTEDMYFNNKVKLSNEEFINVANQIKSYL